MSKQSKIINAEYRRGFERGYDLGLREGFSEGRFEATMRVIEINMKGK